MSRLLQWCIVSSICQGWNVVFGFVVHGGMMRSISQHMRESMLQGVTTTTETATNLQGFESFLRSNPKSDKISANTFHHVEFYCGDATTTYKRFVMGLGMELIAKSDQSTGNTMHASYVVRSGEMQMIFTAPYSSTIGTATTTATSSTTKNEKSCDTIPFPSFQSENAFQFFCQHGLGVKAIAIEVDDVTSSHNALIQNGAVSCLTPVKIQSNKDTEKHLGYAEYAEVALYGDVILRLVNSKHYTGAFLPHFTEKITTATSGSTMSHTSYGLTRYDHIVGNVWELGPSMARVKKMTVSCGQCVMLMITLSCDVTLI